MPNSAEENLEIMTFFSGEKTPILEDIIEKCSSEEFTMEEINPLMASYAVGGKRRLAALSLLQLVGIKMGVIERKMRSMSTEVIEIDGPPAKKIKIEVGIEQRPEELTGPAGVNAAAAADGTVNDGTRYAAGGAGKAAHDGDGRETPQQPLPPTPKTAVAASGTAHVAPDDGDGERDRHGNGNGANDGIDTGIGEGDETEGGGPTEADSEGELSSMLARVASAAQNGKAVATGSGFTGGDNDDGDAGFDEWGTKTDAVASAGKGAPRQVGSSRRTAMPPGGEYETDGGSSLGGYDGDREESSSRDDDDGANGNAARGQYKCREHACRKTFGDYGAAAKHCLDVHNKDRVVCRRCHFVASDRTKLTAHSRRRHGKNIPPIGATCRKCMSYFDKRIELVRHQRTSPGCHPARSCVCSKCGAPFEERPELVRHQMTHPGCKPKRSNSCVCSKCGAPFEERPELVKHQMTHPGCKPKRSKAGSGRRPRRRASGGSKKAPAKMAVSNAGPGDLMERADVAAVIQEVKAGMRKARPGLANPIVKAREFVYVPADSASNTVKDSDCFVEGMAKIPVKRTGEDVLVTFVRGEAQDVHIKSVTVWDGLNDSHKRYEALARIPDGMPARDRTSSCRGTCKHEDVALFKDGKMRYAGCLTHLIGKKRCTKGDWADHEISQIPRIRLPNGEDEVVGYSSYAEVINGIADDVTPYVRHLLPEHYKRHVDELARSQCTVGDGGVFTTVSHVDMVGSHIHNDRNCVPNTLTVLAIFGEEATETDSGRKRMRHVLSDFGERGANGKVELGLEFHLEPSSVHIENAHALRHGSTSPTVDDLRRVALVFYLSKGLSQPDHGRGETVHKANDKADDSVDTEGAKKGAGEESGGGLTAPPPPTDSEAVWIKIQQAGGTVATDVTDKLAELELELSEGDITEKGYGKKRLRLLEPILRELEANRNKNN